jgi:hypothetical protein
MDPIREGGAGGSKIFALQNFFEALFQIQNLYSKSLAEELLIGNPVEETG